MDKLTQAKLYKTDNKLYLLGDKADKKVSSNYSTGWRVELY